MKIKHIILAIFISCALFILIFTYIVHKPLTIGVMKEYYVVKLSYLSNTRGNKLVLLAGSNGRFSHRCETIEKYMDIPCVNMSITANISLDYQFKVLRPYLKEGDIVYLPLEYGALRGTKDDLMSGLELPYIAAYDHGSLFRMDYSRIVQAIFYFDLKFLLSGLSEMLLQKLGVQRRFNIKTLTANGDERNHSEKNSLQYREYLNNLNWKPPTLKDFNEKSYKTSIVRDFLKWAHANNIHVYGGLPTTFIDEPIPLGLIENMRNFYLEEGHDFLVFDNKSQYPRKDFYDTAYHLNESRQISHSRIVAKTLINALEKVN